MSRNRADLADSLQRDRDPLAKELQEILNEPKESVTQEAHRIINGQRRQDYGPVTTSFEQIATIATILTGIGLSATDIAKIMMAVKLVRESNHHHRDNMVDLCGYADLLQQLVDAGQHT